ncbi:MAG: hypothetical protein WD226_07035 [Planctomycetota bacterium]
MRLFLVLLVASGVSLAGCRTTEMHRPFAQAREAATVRTGTPSAGWNVLDDGELAGSAVLFSGRDDGTYVVRNAWGQDLGLVDGLGRAWRFAPHQTEAEWVGSGSVQDGVAEILRRDAATLALTPWKDLAGSTDLYPPRFEIPSSSEGDALEEDQTKDPERPRRSTTTATSP